MIENIIFAGRVWFGLAELFASIYDIVLVFGRLKGERRPGKLASNFLDAVQGALCERSQ